MTTVFPPGSTDNRLGATTPIDPFARLRNRCYSDGRVTVLPATAALPQQVSTIVRTKNFDVWYHQGQLSLRHRIPQSAIHDGLTAVIVDDLVTPGWISGNDVFERIFVGIVLTSRPDPLDAWVLFYRNSIAQMDGRTVPSVKNLGASAVLDDFAAIHRYADGQVPENCSVLEIGSCFGFLSMLLARRSGRQVIASDICASTVRLLDAVAQRMGSELQTMICDAGEIPLPDGAVDVVLLVHILEHLDAEHSLRALDEATRVAAKRVVVAVPFEDEPSAAYGHLRVITAVDLHQWGRRLVASTRGWKYTVREHFGGWLILDR